MGWGVVLIVLVFGVEVEKFWGVLVVFWMLVMSMFLVFMVFIG